MKKITGFILAIILLTPVLNLRAEDDLKYGLSEYLDYIWYRDAAWFSRLLGNGVREVANLALPNGYSLLMQACRLGKSDYVRLLLSSGATVGGITAKSGRTALHYAAEQGNRDSVALLLERGANINAADNRGMTPLHLAAWGGHDAVVELLAGRGANIHAVSADNYNTLGYACAGGSAKSALFLLDRGADWRLRSTFGHTAIVHAAWAGLDQVVIRLLSLGEDINRRGPWNMTPLFAACNHRHQSTARLLTERGADVRAVTIDGINPVYMAAERNMTATVKLLLSRGAPATVTPAYVVNVPGVGREDRSREALAEWNGETALTRVISRTNADIELCKALVAAGVDVNRRSTSGRTALWYAAFHGRQALCEWLLAAGATGADRPDTASGLSPFHLAAKNGHLAIVKLLAGKVGSIDLAGKAASTALMFAAANGHTKIVEWLVGRGANINARNAGGVTPLVAAAIGGNTEIVSFLLDRGANPAAKTDPVVNPAAYLDYFRNPVAETTGAMTAFQHAAMRGHLGATRLLAKTRPAPDPNLVMPGSESLLMHCIASGHGEIARLLIGLGANPNFTARSSMLDDRPTPLFFAIRYDDAATAKRLIETGAKTDHLQRHRLDPLALAVRENRPALVALLVRHGARCDRQFTIEDVPVTAFQLAVFYGDANMVREMLGRPDGRAQINTRFRVKFQQYDRDTATGMDVGYLRSPLSVAMGSEETVRLLLEKGADPRLADGDGTTPLERALQADWDHGPHENGAGKRLVDFLDKRRLGIVRELLARGAVADSADGRILRAARDPAIVRLLLDKGARVEAAGADGITPLISALSDARGWIVPPRMDHTLAIVDLLLKAGASTKVLTANGRSVLTCGLLSAGDGQEGEVVERHSQQAIETMRKLLAGGKTDINMRNRAGETALGYAMRNGLSRIAAFLRQNGAVL